MSTMMTNILPHDLVVNILSRLPVKYLLRFRCVSKAWNSFFNDPSFIKMHLSHSINNYHEHHLMLTGGYDMYSIADTYNSNESSLADEIVEINDYPFKTPYSLVVEISGSCNGLLLISSIHTTIHDMPYNNLCIWNPSTKEFKKLPDTEFPNDLDHCVQRIVYGFGYDKIIEDYKVVRIVTFEDYSSVSSQVKVYTLGSDSWRRIQDLPDYLTLNSTEGMFVNGALHYSACRKLSTYNYYLNDDDKKVSYMILSLNIENEKYDEIQQPNYKDSLCRMDNGELDGCLCIICQFKVSENFYTEIFVMKDYGVKESWTKVYVSPHFDYFVKPIKFIQNGEMLLTNNLVALFLYDPKCGTEKKLLEIKDWETSCVYDPKLGTAKDLKIRTVENSFNIHTYVESLVSLGSRTFVGKEQSRENSTEVLDKRE